MNRKAVVCIDVDVVDNSDLHPLAGWLYVVIKRHVNRSAGDAFPTVERLAELANMSRASVLRYTDELETKGLIEVVRGAKGAHQPNRYKLPTDTSGDQQVSDSNLSDASQVSERDRKTEETTQNLPVQVSDSNTNHKDINKHQDINKRNNARAREPDFGNVPKQDRLEICRAWASSLSIAPIGAYSERNQHTAAEIFTEGYRATQVEMFVRAKMNDPWWIGKTLTLQKVAELMPQWLLDNDKPRRIVPEGVVNAGQKLIPVEWGVNEFAHQPLNTAVTHG